MNKYKIQHIAKTLAKIHIYDKEYWKIDIDLDWYKFIQWWFNIAKWAYWKTWIIEKEILALNWIDAINLFKKDLKIIVDKLSLISQCTIEYNNQSFLVYKINDNINNNFIFRKTDKISGVWLTISSLHMNDYKKLDLFDKSIVLEYLSESSKVFSYHAKISLLCSALEGLSWKKVSSNWFINYNRSEMKKILWNEDFDKIFWVWWLRHSIQHWDSLEKFKNINYYDIIYSKIIKYFNNKYWLNISENVKFPQRNFDWNYSISNLLLKTSDKEKIDLKFLLENISDLKLINEKWYDVVDFDVKTY